MTIKRLILILTIVFTSTACTLIPNKEYMENRSIASGKLNVEIVSISNGISYGVRFGGKIFYPDWLTTGSHTVSVYLKIANNSKQDIKIDLKDAVLVEGGNTYHASVCVQGNSLLPGVEMDPVRTVYPGEKIERILLFNVPNQRVPDAFVWKGVGKARIAELAQNDE